MNRVLVVIKMRRDGGRKRLALITSKGNKMLVALLAQCSVRWTGWWRSTVKTDRAPSHPQVQPCMKLTRAVGKWICDG